MYISTIEKPSNQTRLVEPIDVRCAHTEISIQKQEKVFVLGKKIEKERDLCTGKETG